MRESTITVITPFHNTDKELFSGAVSSMEAQRFPSDRIEWIIVVHNSDDDYLDYVKERTRNLKYVRIYELHNDRRTASSPRNYALERVNGTYITFLDSDDMLTPECLSTVVSGMEESGADLGKYRGERRQEDEGITSFLDNRVRFSQTKSLLCFKRGDPEFNKLLTMANMMMSCQVIRTDFLKEHQIRFDEDIKFEEDVIFNLECLRFASSIAVFPQMIGYIYYMHHGSTMQETTMSDERLLRICQDLSKQLELGLEYGFDMRYLFMGHMKMIAEEIQKTERDISVRKEVRDYLLPYYQRIPLPDPNEKFLSASELRRISEENESIILGYDVFDDGADALRRILKKNCDTELGKDWCFETVKTVAEYRKRVPITDYDYYSPYIELTTRIGESEIFSGEEISGYALTSGSSGRRKRIPYIKSQIVENANELRSLLSEGGSSFLLMQSIRSDEKYADGTYLDSITGATLQALEKELKYESFRLEDTRGAVTSPHDLYFARKGITSYHEKLLYALLDRRVERIIAPFTWYILDILHYLERHYNSLLKDMREGITLGGEKHAERADELLKIFTEGFDTPVLTKVWPDLKHVVAGGSSSFCIYTDQLRRYIGDVRYSEGLYASSEGIFARCDENSSLMMLRNDTSYFEFREINPDGSNGETVSLEDVKDGVKYEVIVTNNTGLYRYAMGDVIVVDHKEDKDLFFKLLYKRDNEIILPGGAGIIAPDSLYTAIERLIVDMDLPIGDYSYAVSDDYSHLVIYLEQRGHGDGRLVSYDLGMIAGELDRLLRVNCISYDKARSGLMDECRVIIVAPETQAAYREIRVMRSNLTPDQIKPLRYLDTPAKQRFFASLVDG